ncbi:hypothetical protein VE04_08556, partial [Pseudogymnoascus sp. 24MN13]
MIGDKPAPPVKKTRARRPKVKTGCKTCKLRGVKCDEAKPICRRCISTGRTCDGYGIWGGGGNAYGSVSRITNSSRPPSSLPLTTITTTTITTSTFTPGPLTSTRTLPPLLGATTQHEHRAFEYFFYRTSRKLPGIFDSPFWSTLVFQARACDPAVLHALIALGAVDLGKAARALACAAASSVDDYLVEAFTRFNIHSSLFGQDNILLYTIAPHPSCADHAIPRAFTTFRIARLYLDTLINAIYNLAHQVASLSPASPIPKHYTNTQSHLRSSLDQWLKAFQTSLPTLTTHHPLIAPLVTPLLHTYYTMSTVILSTALSPRDELIYDSHTAAFESMILLFRGVWETILSAHAPLGDEIPDPPGFTADMGFIPPLFFVVLKCRDRGVRREALELLDGAPHREGLWDGDWYCDWDG